MFSSRSFYLAYRFVIHMGLQMFEEKTKQNQSSEFIDFCLYTTDHLYCMFHSFICVGIFHSTLCFPRIYTLNEMFAIEIYESISYKIFLSLHPSMCSSSACTVVKNSFVGLDVEPMQGWRAVKSTEYLLIFRFKNNWNCPKWFLLNNCEFFCKKNSIYSSKFS